jgi:hypothetical protein
MSFQSPGSGTVRKIILWRVRDCERLAENVGKAPGDDQEGQDQRSDQVMISTR